MVSHCNGATTSQQQGATGGIATPTLGAEISSQPWLMCSFATAHAAGGVAVTLVGHPFGELAACSAGRAHCPWLACARSCCTPHTQRRPNRSRLPLQLCRHREGAAADTAYIQPHLQ